MGLVVSFWKQKEKIEFFMEYICHVFALWQRGSMHFGVDFRLADLYGCGGCCFVQWRW